jgi:2-phospho-L-lactate guanylyltransferase
MEPRALFALMPIKDPLRGKSRLAAALSPEERGVLSLWLARRTLGICTQVFRSDCIVVVAGSAEILALARSFGVHALPEAADSNANKAHAAAAAFAIESGADAVLNVPTDLPRLSADALRSAIAAFPARPGCVLVPDHRGAGTNMVGVWPARPDVFSFGEPSLERHVSIAQGLGYLVRIHRHAELEFDLDRPEDYFAWQRDAARAPA